MTATMTIERPQHEQALEHANEIRLAMARHRERIRSAGPYGYRLAAALLEQPDEIVARMKLDYLLRSVHRVGRARAVRIARGLEVPHTRRIGPDRVAGERPPLTHRQRMLVAAELREIGQRSETR